MQHSETTIPLPASGEKRRYRRPGCDQRITLVTKVKADVWKAAKKVRIFADWMS
jgi:hypothetical protein